MCHCQGCRPMSLFRRRHPRLVPELLVHQLVSLSISDSRLHNNSNIVFRPVSVAHLSRLHARLDMSNITQTSASAMMHGHSPRLVSFRSSHSFLWYRSYAQVQRGKNRVFYESGLPSNCREVASGKMSSTLSGDLWYRQLYQSSSMAARTRQVCRSRRMVQLGIFGRRRFSKAVSTAAASVARISTKELKPDDKVCFMLGNQSRDPCTVKSSGFRLHGHAASGLPTEVLHFIHFFVCAYRILFCSHGVISQRIWKAVKNQFPFWKHISVNENNTSQVRVLSSC